MTFWRGYAPNRADGEGLIPARSRILAGLAVLPLVTLTLLFWWRPLIAPEGMLVSASLAYGAALLVLTNGMRWGLGRVPSTGLVVALAALASLLLPATFGLVLLLATLFVNGYLQVSAVERGELPYWFGSLTSVMTAGATVTLIAMLVRLLL